MFALCLALIHVCFGFQPAPQITTFLFRFTFLSRSKSLPTNFFPTSSLARCERRRKKLRISFRVSFFPLTVAKRRAWIFVLRWTCEEKKIIDSKVKRCVKSWWVITTISTDDLFCSKTKREKELKLTYILKCIERKRKKHNVYDKQY